LKPNPIDLKVNPDSPYVFKSAVKRAAARWIDGLAQKLLKAMPPVDWSKVGRVAVLRLDHIGDVLMALPALEALSRALPHAQIDFWVGPWAKEIADLLPSREEFKIIPAPWFDRSKDRVSSRAGIAELSEKIREGRYDAAIDLRGDFRHGLALWRAGVPVRAGQTRTGGRFFLTHPLLHRPAFHEIDQNLDILRQLGISIEAEKPESSLIPRPEDIQSARQIRESLGLTRPLIALHATCLAPAKRWPEDHWRALVGVFPEEVELVVIGSVGEAGDAKRIFEACGKRIIFAMGVFSLPVLAAFLKDCELLIGVDSAPAHIASAVGTPLISLFSGTNVAAQWAPRGKKVTVIQKVPSCSPCERTSCPFDNECMRQITVEEVLKALKIYLR
jgi:heptosyltransferase-2